MNAPRELTTKVPLSPLPEFDSASELSRHSPSVENSFATFIGRARDSRPFAVKPFGTAQMERVKPRSMADSSAQPKNRSTNSSGRMPVAFRDEERFEHDGDSTKAERDAAAQGLNSEDTSNVLTLNLSEPPLPSGAFSKSTAVSKEVASSTVGTPPATVAEDVRRDPGTSQRGKNETESRSLEQAAEKAPNETRSEIISTKGALESAGMEQSCASTRCDSIGGQNGQSSPLPNELDPTTSSFTASQAAPIPSVGDATLSNRSVVVAGESTGTKTVDGTLVAQMDDVMKTMVKGKNSAVKVEQKLPRAALAEFDSTNSDLSEKDKASGASAVKDARPTIPWLPLAMDDGFQGWSAKLELASLTKSVATSEQLFFQISKQAVALKHFNADSMAVVLKPDPETAIFLHLQIQNGLVEVHARFERGDYPALQAGWDQLRESLASQGIRLGPLQNSLSNDYTTAGQTSDKSGFGKGEKHSYPQTPERADAMAEVFSGPPAEATVRPISKSPAGEKRQWEHWA